MSGARSSLALAPLPFAVRWIDSRADAFPERAPPNVALVHAAEPPRELAGAPDGALVVVMTHSHPLDLAIVAEALRQDRFAYVGLIGSATKRARFAGQLAPPAMRREAIAKLVCPIGVPGIKGKEPAVIAASVAAQLLLASSGRVSGRLTRRAPGGIGARRPGRSFCAPISSSGRASPPPCRARASWSAASAFARRSRRRSS